MLLGIQKEMMIFITENHQIEILPLIFHLLLFFSGVSLAHLEVTPWIIGGNVLLNSSNNSVSKGL